MYLLNKDQFLQAAQADSSRLLLDTIALLLPSFLDKGKPMIRDKKVDVLYQTVAMIIYATESDSPNCN
jgi:hypothetical protein